MEYDGFEFIAPNVAGIPLTLIQAFLLIPLFIFVMSFVWITIVKRRSIPAIPSVAIVMCLALFASSVVASEAQPDYQEQYKAWEKQTLESLNSHYSQELSAEQFQALRDFPVVNNEGLNYGPVVNVQRGDEPGDFDSLVLAQDSERMYLFELIGADYVEVKKSN